MWNNSQCRYKQRNWDNLPFTLRRNKCTLFVYSWYRSNLVATKNRKSNEEDFYFANGGKQFPAKTCTPLLPLALDWNALNEKARTSSLKCLFYCDVLDHRAWQTVPWDSGCRTIYWYPKGNCLEGSKVENNSRPSFGDLKLIRELCVVATSFWLKNSEWSLKVRRKPVV